MKTCRSSLKTESAINLKSLVFFAMIFVLSIGACYGEITIWSPRQITPAFVEPGGTFVAEVRGASSLSSSGWSASIANELRTWSCTISSANYTTINRDTENGWKITIAVPSYVPPELFKLTISHTTGGSTSWVNAVSIVKNLETSFYILHITDEHVASEKGDNCSAELIELAAPYVNLINPRFVLHTGDETENGDWDQFQWYIKAKAGYRVPCVTVKGNHDMGAATWESLFGQRSFSFRMGSFYVLAHDFQDPALREWALNDYNTNWSDSSIKYRLIAQHAAIADQYGTGAKSLFRPDIDKPCNLMLMGHWHSTWIVQRDPYYVLSTSSANYSASAAYFNFQKSTTGWTCPEAPNHAYGVNVYSLLYGPSATYVSPNDGTQTTNSVTIKNGYRNPLNFYDGRIKFLMASGKYNVTNGTKLAEYNYVSGTSTKTAVLVKVNIPPSAEGSLTVTIVKDTTPITGSLSCTASPSSIIAGGISTTDITTKILDANDEIVTTATNTITYSIIGPGTWDDGTVEDKNVQAAYGIATIRAKSITRPGNFTINASAEGLTGSTITITVTTSGGPLPYGDVSGDGTISAYDAALTAQAAVSLITLTPEQTKAAEVSGDGEVTAYDAALIAQRAVGLIDKFPIE